MQRIFYFFYKICAILRKRLLDDEFPDRKAGKGRDDFSGPRPPEKQKRTDTRRYPPWYARRDSFAIASGNGRN